MRGKAMTTLILIVISNTYVATTSINFSSSDKCLAAISKVLEMEKGIDIKARCVAK
jgi:hypothetical protein